MNTALYYPHTSASHPQLLKTGLLLWDSLEFIVPHEGVFHNGLHDLTPERRKAVELIGRPIVPSQEEKDAVHGKVEKLIEGGLPTKYLFRPKEENYLIYADKLGSKTWNLLLRHKLIGEAKEYRVGGNAVWDHPVKPELGLLLMTMLAESCAGSTARKVTDARYANSARAAYVTRLSGGEYKKDFAAHETVVVEALAPALPLAGVTLERLIEVRSREDAFMKELRVHYRKEVDLFVERVAKEMTTARDYERIWKAFHDEMNERLKVLRQALGQKQKMAAADWFATVIPGVSAATVTLLTTHSVTAAITTGAATIGLAGAAKLYSSIPANREKREDLMKKNVAGWLYEVGKK